MALADDLRTLGTESRASIDAALDYYTHTAVAWRLLRQLVAENRTFTVLNRLTGGSIDHITLAGRAQQYVTGNLRSSSFQQLVSIFEDYVFDVLRLWLVAHPESLSKRLIDLETVLSAADTSTVLHAVIDRELNELKHKRVGEWFAYLGKLVTITRPTPDQIQALTEAKASRDLLVHNIRSGEPDL